MIEFHIKMRECSCCPKCGLSLDWVTCFAEERLYYARCDNCKLDFYASELNYMEVVGYEDLPF